MAPFLFGSFNHHGIWFCSVCIGLVRGIRLCSITILMSDTAPNPTLIRSGMSRHSQLVRIFLLAFATLPPTVAAIEPAPASDPFPIVESLVVGGARSLALQYIDRHQGQEQGLERWEQWERLRIRLYQDKKEWAAVSARVAKLPDGASESLKQWLVTEAAVAELNLGNAAASRQYLRQLIWKTKSTDKQLAKWRRLVIRSYLLENRIDDAQTAILRYKTDYRATSDAWQILHARVLLRARKYPQAMRLLADVQTTEAQLLSLYAALQGDIYKPEVVDKRCRRLAAKPRLSSEQQQQIWVLAAAAADRSNDGRKVAAFLELALNADYRDTPSDPFFALTPDQLWLAYVKLADTVGNKERLLVGDDAPWLEKANSLAKTDLVTSRAIYAFLGTRAAAEEIRSIAHERLNTSLLTDNKAAVALALYSRSKDYVAEKDIPDAVRYQLANEALKDRDIGLAARWMRDLRQPPVGEDKGEWMLRRARTLIYAGETGSAIDLLEDMLGGQDQLDAPAAKRIIQVLFDLQAVREHTAALALMDMVYQKTAVESVRRELLYWMAESRDALGDHAQAAELYLRSATLGQPKGADMWGQSARFQAAESLGKAGFVADARNIFEHLLRYTDDAKRRALIERKLQQLWLVENRATTQ